MPALLFRRASATNNSNNSNGTDNSMRNLLVTLVVLVAFCLVLGGSLYAIRRHRKARKDSGTLPSYDAATRSFGGGGGGDLTIQTNRDSAYVFSEKQHLIDNSTPMSMTPDSVPEIRITFPEEEDREGRRISGRVVVVQVGEAGVGYVRPLEHDLPPYQTQATERFDSVDIDRIGGLKETGGRGSRVGVPMHQR